MIDGNKMVMRVLAKVTALDPKTIHHSNLQNIAAKWNLEIEALTPMNVKQNMFYFPTPMSEMWHISFLKELLTIKSNEYLVEFFDLSLIHI